jgi:CheY-like chemotaxis protein
MRIKFFCRALRRAGVASCVHLVKDGKEAIKYLQGQEQYADRNRFPLPEILLLDLNMPGMDGLEVLKWVRCQPNPLGQLPVIIQTGCNHHQNVSKAYVAGASALVVKHVSLDRWVEQLRSLENFWLAGATHRPRPQQWAPQAIQPRTSVTME